MRVLGIIAEYNPIHTGHIYHLEQSKEISKADFVVCVMSGDFTQRGEPAFLDKWTRARQACECGVDLVLELPFVFATASAEGFARGGIGILEGLGNVDAVSFGSESGDADELQFLAAFLKDEPPEYREALKKHLNMGISFPKARELAVNECLGLDAGAILKTPNNILAIEYLKHIVTMTPITIKRLGEYHAEGIFETQRSYALYDKKSRSGSQAFAAAGAIRGLVRDGRLKEAKPFITENIYSCIAELEAKRENAFGGFTRRYYDMIRTVILKSSLQELSAIAGMTEGMENKLKKEIRNHDDYDDYARALKSKRFTRSAIDRLLCRTLIGLSKEHASAREFYTRVLAFNDKGSELLAKIRETKRIPVVTNINKYDDLPAYSAYDVIATDMYNLLTGRDLYDDSDHVMHPCKAGDSCV